MNVLVTGGCGYIGSLLVPQLLAEGHFVTVFDNQMFGNGHLPKDNANLTIVKEDIRNLEAFRAACVGQKAVIYFASISSETMCQKDYNLAMAVNAVAFQPCVMEAKNAKVERFIFASSVAAYGSSEKDAKEEIPLTPSTVYGQGKSVCEEIVKLYSKHFRTIITRSASVCGYSPHQRFDLTINRMVNDAYRKGVITVNGGRQKRSHIHIQDVCDAYKWFLTAEVEGIFNIVHDNQTILETAQMVQRHFSRNVKIEVKERTDDRSYSVDGTKLRLAGFKTTRPLGLAVQNLFARFDSGYWPDSQTNPIYQNVL